MRLRGRVWLVLTLVLLGPPLFVGWLMLRIVLFADEYDEGPADAALVLGAAAWNGRPSPVFEERIKHALALYREGRVRALVFTGGFGRGDNRAEAEVARTYALKRGIPGGAIFVETASRSTFDNLAEAKPILEAQRFGRVLLVSDPLHMRRAVSMARDLGIDARPSPTPTTRFVGIDAKLELLLKETWNYAMYRMGRHFVDLSAERPEFPPADLSP